MSKMIHKVKNFSLTKALDIDPISQNNMNQEIIVPQNIEPKNDAEEDYIITRNTMRNLIDKGTKAIDELYEIAKASEHPRSFEVLSNLIKTTSDVSKDLYALQKTTKELKEVSNKTPQGDITVEKAVFVGTTADLLKKIKEEK